MVRRYNNSFQRTHAFGFSDIQSIKFIINKRHVCIPTFNKLWVLQNKKYTQVFRSSAWDVWLGKVVLKSVKLKIYQIRMTASVKRFAWSLFWLHWPLHNLWHDALPLMEGVTQYLAVRGWLHQSGLLESPWLTHNRITDLRQKAYSNYSICMYRLYHETNNRLSLIM